MVNLVRSSDFWGVLLSSFLSCFFFVFWCLWLVGWIGVVGGVGVVCVLVCVCVLVFVVCVCVLVCVCVGVLLSFFVIGGCCFYCFLWFWMLRPFLLLCLLSLL